MAGPGDDLFLALAQAKALPDKWARAVGTGGEAARDILGGYSQGLALKRQLAEYPLELANKKAALLNISANLAKEYGPDRANQMMSQIYQSAGVNVPTMGETSGTQETPEQLINMGEYGANKLGAQEKALAVTNNAPFSPEVANAIGNGDVAELTKIHAAKGEPVPYREVQQAISAKRPNMMGGYFNTRANVMQANQLPSQAPVNEPAGAAYSVKVAARQGKALIGKATSPQNLALASVDLSRAIARAAPQSEVIGAGNYAQSLPTLWSQLQQKITSDPTGPDVPKLRKQLYDTFDELDKAATPWIVNRLQNMEDNGLNSSYGNKWNSVKQRELGETTPDIPFDSGSGSAQNQNISTGIAGQNSGGWSYVGPVKNK